jgi:uncharacterized protein involved in cysteine biosynthesis
MMGELQQPRLTFADGVRSLTNGFKFLASDRAARRLAVVPGLVALVLWVSCLVLAVRYVPDLVARLLPSLAQLSEGWSLFVDVVTFLVMAPLALILAMLVTPVLCAPVMERLVRLRERALGAGPRAAVGLIRELMAALSAQLGALLLFGPVIAALWMVSLMAAPLAPLISALQFLVGSAWLAFSLLDYPLSLRGVSFRGRLALFRSSAMPVLGFGIACALLFAIPLFGLWGLPVAVVGAAELALTLEQRGN